MEPEKKLKAYTLLGIPRVATHSPLLSRRPDLRSRSQPHTRLNFHSSMT